MSPESLKSQTYSSKSDVWTFGIVVYEIVARQEPHTGLDQMETGIKIRNEGLSPKIPSCHPILQNIMTQCWNLDPENRPNFEIICNMLEQAK